MHFLLHCEKYSEIRTHYFSKFSLTIQNFLSQTNEEKMKILLGEGPMATTAAKYILAWLALVEHQGHKVYILFIVLLLFIYFYMNDNY